MLKINLQDLIGTLKLSLDVNQRIIAKWLINNEQEQVGTGFLRIII